MFFRPFCRFNSLKVLNVLGKDHFGANVKNKVNQVVNQVVQVIDCSFSCIHQTLCSDAFLLLEYFFLLFLFSGKQCSSPEPCHQEIQLVQALLAGVPERRSALLKHAPSGVSHRSAPAGYALPSPAGQDPESHATAPSRPCISQ